MTQKKENNTALIAGILFAALAVLCIFPIYFSIFRILQIIGLAVISYALITKRRDIVLCAGYAVLAIIFLLYAVRERSSRSIFSWLSALAYIAAASGLSRRFLACFLISIFSPTSISEIL